MGLGLGLRLGLGLGLRLGLGLGFRLGLGLGFRLGSGLGLGELQLGDLLRQLPQREVGELERE